MVDWLLINQTSGSGDTQILIRALPYTGNTARDTTLVLSGLTKHIDIDAMQVKFVNTISISPDVAIFRYSGSTQQFSLESNYNWNVTSYPDWLALTPLSGGSGTTIITATSSYNTEFTAKTSDIVVSSLTTSDTSVVTLEAKPETLDVIPDSYEFDDSGGTTSFTIRNNAEWVISDIPSWLTVSDVSGTSGTTIITVTASTNNTDYSRSAYITVSGVTKTKQITITQKYTPISRRYFTMEVLTAGKIFWACGSSTGSYVSRTIEYRINGGTWNSITSQTSYTSANTINVVENDVVEFKGDNSSYGEAYKWNGFRFNSDITVNLKGNIMSMIDSIGFDNCYDFTSAYALTSFLETNSNAIQDASQLVLQATGLTDYCYYRFLGANRAMTGIPSLPATTIKKGCYSDMFYNCKVTDLSNYSLPATTLEDHCYYNMFASCTLLTNSPELPAQVLEPYCYAYMFNGCSSLNSIKCLATDMSANRCTTNWVYGVANSGTFIKDSSATWSTGNSGIPSGWTVEDAT